VLCLVHNSDEQSEIIAEARRRRIIAISRVSAAINFSDSHGIHSASGNVRRIPWHELIVRVRR
jgi:hypothetical protein